MAVFVQCPIFDEHVRCIVDKTRDFPGLKIDANKQLSWNLLTTGECRKRGTLRDVWGKWGLGSICLQLYFLIIHGGQDVSILIPPLPAHSLWTQIQGHEGENL